uniref:Mannosyltransferase n=1 Tax=Mucochytrium quahogii TaxID=96639 RepID=A0A7S2WIL7_9STRA|mmetsp:Transcript_3239/g.5998  ORF Transcript_3239/g.5998 Transcript_3239/m.5998 type:complete len:533 (+) Transcript_3239:141-1739(+)
MGFKILFIVSNLYAILAPFTKVEESFNVQAMHDVHNILFSGAGLEGFDHFEFPGVVPRTFIGAIVTTLIAQPLCFAAKLILPFIDGIVHVSPGMVYLICVRVCLTSMVCLALRRLAEAVKFKFGKDASDWFFFVCVSQFHIMFYMGRPLPNTFALGICAIALARWLEGSFEECIAYLVFCTVVFRCDTLILTGIVALMILVRREASIMALVVDGIASGVSSLFLTCTVDSVMWWKPVWPEGTVLFFNTVLNKSSEWGVMSRHWYFSSALPRALLFSYVLVFASVFQPLEAMGKVSNTRNSVARFVLNVFDVQVLSYLFIPSILYVALYSILPHKEVRFLFQVFPFFNCMAAVAMAKFQRTARRVHDKKKADFRAYIGWVAYAGSYVALICSALVAMCFVAVSSMNYPGAHALIRLQSVHHASGSGPAQVHYCTYGAMSGISRFLEDESDGLRYSKREDEPFLDTLCLNKSPFKYLIMEVDRFAGDNKCSENFEILDTIQGKPKLQFHSPTTKYMLPIKIATQPDLYILIRKQ